MLSTIESRVISSSRLPFTSAGRGGRFPARVFVGSLRDGAPFADSSLSLSLKRQEVQSVSRFSVKGVLLASLVAVALPACSTVIRTADASDDLVMTEERAALKEAAADLAWSPWPKPEDSSFAGRLAGAEAGKDRMTRDRAVEIYLASFGPDADAAGRIAADARRHLVAAAALADIGERASDSPSPKLSDVAVLEASIADLRETRAVYLAALRRIDAEDAAIDAIRDPLDAAVKKLSRVADDLAESAMKKRSSNFAGPDSTAALNGAL